MRVKSAKIKFNLYPGYRTLLSYVGWNDSFPTTEYGGRLDTFATIKSDTPVSVPDGFLMAAEIIITGSDVDVDIRIEYLDLISETGELDIIRTNQKITLSKDGNFDSPPTSTLPTLPPPSNPIKILRGSLKYDFPLKNRDISIWGNLNYYGNHNRLDEPTKNIATLSIQREDPSSTGSISYSYRVPALIYSFTVNIYHNNGQKDVVRMKFPLIAYNKSVYISEEGNTRLGVALHPGRPMEYINGQSPSGRT